MLNEPDVVNNDPILMMCHNNVCRKSRSCLPQRHKREVGPHLEEVRLAMTPKQPALPDTPVANLTILPSLYPWSGGGTNQLTSKL